jgi:predicted secreted protein
MKKSFFLLLIAFVFSINLYAQGQDWKLNFTGFSNDGKYLASEEYGGQDPSDSLLSNLYFIDVAANKYARKPSVLEETDYENVSLETVRKRARTNNESVVNQLRIVDGNTGTKVFSTNAKEGTDKVAFTHKSIKYQLNLKDIFYKYQRDKLDARDVWDLARFELSIKNQKTKSVQILQKDGAKVHRGSMGYGIKEVYLFQNMIAVFLEYQTFGHHGQTQYLVVTGKIK